MANTATIDPRQATSIPAVLALLQAGQITTDQASQRIAELTAATGKEPSLERRTGESARTGKPYSGWTIRGNHPPAYVSDAVMASIKALAEGAKLPGQKHGPKV